MSDLKNEKHDAPGGSHGDGHGNDKTFEIKIDRTQYKVQQDVLTGAELRRLSEPDIGPDRGPV